MVQLGADLENGKMHYKPSPQLLTAFLKCRHAPTGHATVRLATLAEVCEFPAGEEQAQERSCGPRGSSPKVKYRGGARRLRPSA